MGKSAGPPKVNVIAGMISKDTGLFVEARKILERKLGGADYESPIFNFDFTDYYKDEMGGDLKRKFLSFGKLRDPAGLYGIKIFTNSLEDRFSRNGKRAINIDPGYLDLAKLVLFTTKDYSHRVYLDKGIYAESTLFYKDRTFNAWPWSYPDYKTDSHIEVFNSMREMYRNKIQGR